MQHTTFFDRYTSYDQFGKIPIVYIPEHNIEYFLRNRIGDWQRELRKYGGDASILDADLLSLDADALRQHYEALVTWCEKSKGVPPKASYALRQFMEDNLGNLTPGTRDSEIHFIRAVMLLIDAIEDQNERVKLLEAFTPSLSAALIFLCSNVLDSRDGLPFGADSRDIFADILYDSKTLCNASYWYQTLTLLHKHAESIENSSFKTVLITQLENITADLEGSFLWDLTSRDKKISDIFQHTKLTLGEKIKTLFFNNEGVFCAKDFIPGERALMKEGKSIVPLPAHVSHLLMQNPSFSAGEMIDPQGIAIAVISGLIEKKYYDDVIDFFEKCDSEIGIKVFVPISGATEEENHVLKTCGGQVVWANIGYLVVQALHFMDTPRSNKMAIAQKEKLMALPGLGEWYAKTDVMAMPFSGGSPIQGWHASKLIELLPYAPSASAFFNALPSAGNQKKPEIAALFQPS